MERFHVKIFRHLLIVLLAMCCNQTLSAQDWVSIPGIKADDIGIGKNGSVWITATDGSIHRWNGSKFEKMPGGAKRVAVAPDGNAWVVNSGGEIHRFNNATNQYTRIDGGARDIGVGADGSVWRIGMSVVPGGYDIYQWNGTSWDKRPGGGVRIAVDPAGIAWVVNDTGTPRRWNNGNWQSLSGEAQDIGIGADGSVWYTGKGNGTVYQWTGSGWVQKSGAGRNIAVSPAGDPWVVNADGEIYRSGPAVIANNTLIIIPCAAPGAKGKVRFQNTGGLDVKLYRSSANNKDELVTEISRNSGVEVNATAGDRFKVEFIGKPEITHRMIYVPELGQTYFIYGNVAMTNFAGFGINFSTLTIDPNLYGVDTAHFSRRDLVTTMNKRQIFERLNTTIGTDYEMGDDNIMMKAGFSFSGVGKTNSTNNTRMAYGYSNFSSGWNIALSGAFPIKGVDVAGGFGYGESQTTQSSSTDIYTYERFQTVTHQVAVTPGKAYLDPAFVERVRSLKTAADAKNLVNDYGTHYPSVIYYGGDFSSYLKMSSTDYMQATSKNIDLQAEVSVNTPSKTKKKKGTTTKEAGGSYGGKMDFSYKEGSEERRILERSQNEFKVTGGEYDMNGDYSITRSNAAPLVTSLRRIDELITPMVIKDDIDPAHIAKAHALVKQAIDAHIAKYVSTVRQIQLPPPNIYEVTLDKMQVTNHFDDFNANTKGKVEAKAFGDAALTISIPYPHASLWEQTDYSLDFRFSPNHTKNFTNAKQVFLHYPDPKTGQFKPFYINVYADVREKDDLGGPDGARFEGSAGPVELHGLNLQPGGQGASRSFDIANNNGIIRFSYTIKKMENDFDSPGMLDYIVTGVPDPSNAPSNNASPASDVGITLFNDGGYMAKFQVTYTVEGHSKSYESGDVAVGWKHTLPIPPNATNIVAKGIMLSAGEHLIFEEKLSAPADVCYKTYGTIFDRRWSKCN